MSAGLARRAEEIALLVDSLASREIKMLRYGDLIDSYQFLET